MTLISFLKKPLAVIIIWGLILEFPLRYFVSPDPWIHSSQHWYFNQPNRLIIELAFVLFSILPFFWLKELKELLAVRWKKNNSFLIYGVLGAIFLFTVQQWDKIILIQSKNLEQYIPIWFLTGLAIGIGQELTFRGLIYTGIDKKYGAKWAVVISTLCFTFGSIHSPRMYKYFTNGYVFEALLLFFIFILSGLFFVWIRAKTKSIIIPALIHGIGNAITWFSFVIVKLYVI